MPKWLLAVAILFVPCLAHGQGIPYAVSPPAPSAQISVCSAPATGSPCTNQSAAYFDAAQTQLVSQPFTISPTGNLLIYLSAGTYTIQITGRQDQIISLGGGVGSITGCPSPTANNWIRALSTAGVCTKSQPAFTDISGNISVNQMNSGTSASVSTFWRGDNSWGVPPGFGNPMTTLGDLIYGGASGTATRLAGPTGPNGVPQFLMNIPSGSAAVAETFGLSGIAGRTVSGTSDTILETDRGSAVTYTSASAGAIVVPQAGSTTGTSSNFVFKTRVTGAGAMTFTPATSTVNGLATLVQTSGECTWQSFDNSVYVADCNSPSSRVGTSVTLQGISGFHVCTGTCTVTVPVPKPGSQFCVYNDDNVSTVITLAALGSSSMYENQARTAYGTAATGTLVSGGAVKDSACILGRDGTHYLFVSGNGTWTAN